MTFYDTIITVGNRVGSTEGEENFNWVTNYLELPQIAAPHIEGCAACHDGQIGIVNHTLQLSKDVFNHLTCSVDFTWDGLLSNDSEIPAWESDAQIYLRKL